MPVSETSILDDTPLKKMSDVVNKPVSEYDNLFNKEAQIIKDGNELSDKFSNLARSKDAVDRMTRLL